MTEQQANDMIQQLGVLSQYQQDLYVRAGAQESTLLALHQGLLILCCFVIVFGITLMMQGRPRSG
jgi:hypothetical protein